MSAFQQRPEPVLHPLYVDDLLALSRLSPRDLAHEIGVSVRDLHKAAQDGATGEVAEALLAYERELPAEWGLEGGRLTPKL